jgi:hypothetical protein
LRNFTHKDHEGREDHKEEEEGKGKREKGRGREENVLLPFPRLPKSHIIILLNICIVIKGNM